MLSWDFFLTLVFLLGFGFYTGVKGQVKPLELVSFLLIGLVYLYLIANLVSIVEILKRGEIYSSDIGDLLFLNGRLSLFLTGLYGLINLLVFLFNRKILFGLPWPTLIVFPFIFIVLGLMFYLLGYIYKEVIEIKEENDLTI